MRLTKNENKSIYYNQIERLVQCNSVLHSQSTLDSPDAEGHSMQGFLLGPCGPSVRDRFGAMVMSQF